VKSRYAIPPNRSEPSVRMGTRGSRSLRIGVRGLVVPGDEDSNSLKPRPAISRINGSRRSSEGHVSTSRGRHRDNRVIGVLLSL
jgi:hypothetical protein